MGTRALLIMDMQKGFFDRDVPVYREKELLSNINALADAFRRSLFPVLFIRHADDYWLVEGTSGWDVHDGLHIVPGDTLLKKGERDAFKERSVIEALENLNAKSVVIAGLVTHGCVKSACLGALEKRYVVTLAADAHSSFDQRAAELIVEWNVKIAKAGAKVITTKEIINSLC